MVHVSVGEEDHIDGWQRFDCDAGTPLAAQDNQAFREYWVDEELSSVNLQEKRGVANECDPKLVGVYWFDGPGDPRHWLFVALAYQPPELFHLSNCEWSAAPRSLHSSHQ
jgi:hypothetical protein